MAAPRQVHRPCVSCSCHCCTAKLWHVKRVLPIVVLPNEHVPQAMLAEKKGGVGTVDLSKLNRASQATTSGGGVGLDAEIAAGALFRSQLTV